MYAIIIPQYFVDCKSITMNKWLFFNVYKNIMPKYYPFYWFVPYVTVEFNVYTEQQHCGISDIKKKYAGGRCRNVLYPVSHHSRLFIPDVPWADQAAETACEPVKEPGTGGEYQYAGDFLG